MIIILVADGDLLFNIGFSIMKIVNQSSWVNNTTTNDKLSKFKCNIVSLDRFMVLFLTKKKTYSIYESIIMNEW